MKMEFETKLEEAKYELDEMYELETIDYDLIEDIAEKYDLDWDESDVLIVEYVQCHM